MTQPVSLSDLLVVGYADVLPSTLKPLRLPPVFRWRDDPDRFLLPPFHLNLGLVYNGTEVNDREAKRLAKEERITLLPGDGCTAERDHELWIDLEGRVHYQPRVQADEALQRIYRDHLTLAERAFRGERWGEAERHCGICILADERKLDPYFMKAAILQRQGRTRGVERLRELTGRFIAPGHFDQCVASLALEMKPVAGPMYMVAACHSCCA